MSGGPGRPQTEGEGVPLPGAPAEGRMPREAHPRGVARAPVWWLIVASPGAGAQPGDPGVARGVWGCGGRKRGLAGPGRGGAGRFPWQAAALPLWKSCCSARPGSGAPRANLASPSPFCAPLAWPSRCSESPAPLQKFQENLNFFPPQVGRVPEGPAAEHNKGKERVLGISTGLQEAGGSLHLSSPHAHLSSLSLPLSSCRDGGGRGRLRPRLCRSPTLGGGE